MQFEVVDASAVSAVLFAEAGAEDVTAALEGYRLAAPTLLSYELASVCLKKMKRHPRERADHAQALGRFEEMGIAEAEVDIDGVLLLAERKRLSAYDASYLWLARELGIDLVTLDRRLAAASAR
jgi:predicted nucleic acid-binding protein